MNELMNMNELRITHYTQNSMNINELMNINKLSIAHYPQKKSVWILMNQWILIN